MSKTIGYIEFNGTTIEIKFWWVNSEDIGFCYDGMQYITSYKSLIYQEDGVY